MCVRTPQKKFFFYFLLHNAAHQLQNDDNLTYMTYNSRMSWQTLPFEARKLQATESRLQAIYDAAKIGLKGDALALAAGMLPTEYRQLTQMDPVAEMAELKGRADGEAELSRVMHHAALDGDAKVALEILKHRHDWQAAQRVQLEVTQQISITDALAQAKQRVIEGLQVQDIEHREVGASTPAPKLTVENNAKADL